MAEVGVLNLTIKDNSEQAAQGLNNLTDALRRIKNAIKGGYDLSGVAKSVEALGKAVDSSIHGSTIAKLSQLADSLSKMKGMGPIHIHIKDSGVERVRRSAKETTEEINNFSSQFETVSSHAEGFAEHLERAREIMQSLGMEGNGKAEEFANMFNAWSSARSARSLPGTSALSTVEIEKGWTEWKNGAIEVEGTVSDASDNIGGYLEGTQLRLTGVVDTTIEAKAATEDWLSSAQKLNSEYAKMYKALPQRTIEDYFNGTYYRRLEDGQDEAYQRINDKMSSWLHGNGKESEQLYALSFVAMKLGMTIGDVRAKIAELSGSGEEMNSFGMNASAAIERVNATLERTKTDLMSERVGVLKQQLASDVAQGKVSEQQFIERAIQIQNYESKLDSLKSKEEEATESTKSLKDALKDLFKNITDNPLGNLLKQFARIAKYRILRNVIKHIGQGFKEGINDVYEYSKAVGTSFAPTMDSLKQTMAGFKSSLGAAIAPVLEALIPILNSIVNAAIPVINVLNQLFALLGGHSSWSKPTTSNGGVSGMTKSLDGMKLAANDAGKTTTSAMDDIEKAAGGASGSMKEMLASFDELNVIASQSGGGGSGKASADYAGMFGESFAFDPAIVDFVNWLKDNLDSLKGIAIAVGTALAAWKFSKAFTDILPWLSQLFGLIATGAAIAITLQLNWLFTNQYLDTKKPGWLFADALTTAVGATAAWKIAKKLVSAKFAKYAAMITLVMSAYTGIKALLGATDVSALSTESIATAIENALKVGAAAAILYKTVGGLTIGQALGSGAVVAATVFGAVIGLKVALDPNIELFSAEFIATSIISAAVVGLGVAIISGIPVIGAGAAIATFLAYIALKVAVKKDDIKWGKVELTQKQVENFVNGKMFKIDVKTTAKIITETIDTTEVKKSEIEAAVVAALGTLEVINLGLDTSDNYETLHTQVDGVVAAIQGFVEAAKAENKLTVQLTPTLVGETEDEQGNWLKNNSAGWSEIESFASTQGRKIGELLDKGMKGTLKEGEPELLNQLMQELADVSSAITKAQISGEAYAALSLGLGDLTEASFNDVITMFEDYKKTLTEQYEALAVSQIGNQEALVAGLLKIDPEAKDKVTQQAIKDLEEMKKNIKKAVDDSVNEATEPGRNLILEWIFGRQKKGGITEFDLSMYEYSLVKPADIFKMAKSAKDVRDQLHVMLMQNSDLTADDIKVMDMINFSGFDLLSEKLQKQIVDWMGGVTLDNIELLKDGLGMDVSQIIKFSDWSNLTPELQFQLATALSEAFGATETIKALMGSGIDVTSILDLAISSDDPAIKEMAKEWKKAIESATGDEKAKPEVEIGVDQASLTGAKDAVTAGIEEGTKAISVAADATKLDAMSTSVKDSIEEKTEGVKISVATEALNAAATGFKKAIEGIKPKISASATITVTVNGKIKLSAESASADRKKIETESTILTFGTGGFPHTGELYMANEDGSNEYIGSIGGKPAVANQDQIVNGISSGVKNANEEQNALLREQNNLLRQLLAKEFNVSIGSSVGFGRTASQSLEMYNRMKG